MKVPYDWEGNLLSYPRSILKNGTLYPPEWKENEPFAARIEVRGITRGQSAARFVLRGIDTGRTYEMFMKDMAEMVPHAKIVYGLVLGHWDVVKRGRNYGIRYLGRSNINEETTSVSP